SNDLGSFTFSRDGRTLLTAGHKTGLDFWDVPGNRHLSSVAGLTVSKTGFDKAVYLPDGQGLAVGTPDHGVVFTDAQGIRTPRAPLPSPTIPRCSGMWPSVNKSARFGATANGSSTWRSVRTASGSPPGVSTTPPGSGKHGPGKTWPLFPVPAPCFGCSGHPRG